MTGLLLSGNLLVDLRHRFDERDEAGVKWLAVSCVACRASGVWGRVALVELARQQRRSNLVLRDAGPAYGTACLPHVLLSRLHSIGGVVAELLLLGLAVALQVGACSDGWPGGVREQLLDQWSYCFLRVL